MHDPWFYVRERGKADSVTQLKASPPGHAPVSEQEINQLIQRMRKLIREAAELQLDGFTGLSIGGHARNRTGVHGFAVRCVTTPPRGLVLRLGEASLTK